VTARPTIPIRRTPRDRGSVFIESMVAAAIVAMGLAATFQVISDSARRNRDVDSHRAALLIAQSELAAVGSEFPLHAGETMGGDGDFIWRIEVSPYSDGVASSAAGGLWRVSVAIRPRAGGPDLVTLQTLRLGPRPE
jgi:hypothetical protein